MKRRKLDKMILSTLTGVAGGAILGMLFAPDKGSSTRKKITKQSDKYLKKIRKDINGVRKYLNKRAEEAKTELDELKQNTKSKSNDVVEEAKKLISYEEWTKDELYERAKEIQIDGYSQMNKDELIEALKKDQALRLR